MPEQETKTSLKDGQTKELFKRGDKVIISNESPHHAGAVATFEFYGEESPDLAVVALDKNKYSCTFAAFNSKYILPLSQSE